MSLVVVFLLVMDVQLTGIAIHEWLGIGIGIGLVTHLVQHGNWLATVTKRFKAATSPTNRLNYVMTGLLFVAFFSIIGSGLVISEVALPFLGIVTSDSAFWLWLHIMSVDFVLVLTALHIALNWQWIAKTTKRIVVNPARRAVSPGYTPVKETQ
jgi:hypothetical protein